MVRFIFLFLFSLSLVALTIIFLKNVSEKYFFDKFVYGKSLNYGYITKKTDIYDKKLFDRYKDTLELKKYLEKKICIDNSFNEYNQKDEFTILILGDSYVWGQGLKKEQRFLNILNNKLNKYKKTRIVSLGYPGDNIFDNYIKYVYGKDIFNPDLVIFTLVHNDLLLNENNRYYDDFFYKKFSKKCSYIDLLEIKNDHQTFSGENYQKMISESLDLNSKNRCFYSNLLKLLPKNAIYINLDEFTKNETLEIENIEKKWKETIQELENNGFLVLKPKTTIIKDNSLRVSNADSHPSAKANLIISDLIYESIIVNNF